MDIDKYIETYWQRLVNTLWPHVSLTAQIKIISNDGRAVYGQWLLLSLDMMFVSVYVMFVWCLRRIFLALSAETDTSLVLINSNIYQVLPIVSTLNKEQWILHLTPASQPQLERNIWLGGYTVSRVCCGNKEGAQPDLSILALLSWTHSLWRDRHLKKGSKWKKKVWKISH